MSEAHSHHAAALAVLMAADPEAKANAAAAGFERLRAGMLTIDLSSDHPPPVRPRRPTRPVLVDPRDVPRRKLGSVAGRVALLHAVAHIEFNAIDLAFDLAARFAAEVASAGLDAGAFVDDWFAVGADEARHFKLLTDRLADLGAAYGDLAAHDGLWRAAETTADDLAARLAIAPMTLEARGLDVTPAMVERLSAAGDSKSAAALETIYAEEIGHVAKGVAWFARICAIRGARPEEAYRRIVRERFAGALKPPFNATARALAGVGRAFYGFAEK